MAPIILALQEHPSFECEVCVTAQHRQMLDQVCKVFDIRPDVDLNLMRPDQSLTDFTARALTGLEQYLDTAKPDMVLVQGDTTTVFCATLAAFYKHIPVGHVEAGLRTGNMQSPWPEEANRVLTSKLASLHFAPTQTSRDNLLKEHIADDSILVTGNPVIDALFLALEKIEVSPPTISSLPESLQPGWDSGPRMVLITGHRRENFGDGFDQICHAIADLSAAFPEIHFVYPVHLNPRVREPVDRILRGHDRADSNIHLIEPLDYLPFVALMARSYLVLTDSGGVQEEAPSLGKPVLVMRNTTERPEAVEAGTVRLVGARRDDIVAGVNEMLTRNDLYSQMSVKINPYGDGRAAERHVAGLESFFDLS